MSRPQQIVVAFNPSEVTAVLKELDGIKVKSACSHLFIEKLRQAQAGATPPRTTMTHSNRQPLPPHATRRKAAVVYPQRTAPHSKPALCVICTPYDDSQPGQDRTTGTATATGKAGQDGRWR
ncbi:MAG: hypothetical protein AB9Q22_13460 [Candidatus Reddybacter sp.]